MLKVVLISLIGSLLAWVGIPCSETIQTEGGDYYHFEPSEHFLIALLAGVMSGFVALKGLAWLKALHLLGIVILFSYQFVIDLKYRELADEWNAFLGCFTLSYLHIAHPTELKNHLIAGLIVSSAFFLLWMFTNGMGFGDVKFLFATGMLLSVRTLFPYLIIVFGLSTLFGLLHILLLKIQKKNVTLKQEFAFGPFLIIGMVMIVIL